MHQNLAVILQQLCYGKISFRVLVPVRQRGGGDRREEEEGVRKEEETKDKRQ